MAENAEPLGAGGIAAMAAAAALKKKQKKAETTADLEKGSSMDLIDSDDVFSEMNASPSLHSSAKSRQLYKGAPLRPENPIFSASSRGNSSSGENMKIITRPIAKRASMGGDIANFVEELEDNETHENGKPISPAASGSNIAMSSTKGRGRQTYNSTILRPKVQDDHSADEQYNDDDDELTALPSNFSSRHTVAMFGMDNIQIESNGNDDKFDTQSIDSDESGTSIGTKNSTTTVDTFQTIQSFTRKTNLAFEELNKRLFHRNEQSKRQEDPSDVTLRSSKRIAEASPPKPEVNMVSGDDVEQSESWQDENMKNLSSHKSDSDSRDDDSTGGESSIMNGPAGIAVAAAQAAILRMRNTNENNNGRSYGNDGLTQANSFAGGGIAAAAAKAARMRHQQHMKQDVSNNNQQEVAMGSIALAAAQAALKRNQRAQDANVDRHVLNPGSILNDPFAGGGIASAAAKAALKRSQRLQGVN